MNTHATVSRPRCRVFRSVPTVLTQPNTSFDSLPFSLTHLVAIMPRRAAVNRAAALTLGVLRNMRCHIRAAHLPQPNFVPVIPSPFWKRYLEGQSDARMLQRRELSVLLACGKRFIEDLESIFHYQRGQQPHFYRRGPDRGDPPAGAARRADPAVHPRRTSPPSPRRLMTSAPRSSATPPAPNPTFAAPATG